MEIQRALYMVVEVLDEITNRCKDRASHKHFPTFGYQKENLGYVDIVDKKYAGLALVMSVNTKWTPWLTLYALANGKTIECKVDKRDYNRQPVKEGDVVRIEGQTYKSKQRKTENGFEAVPGSKVLWITRYRKVVV